MSKNFYERIHFQSQRGVNTRDEKLHGAVDGWSSAPHLANASAVSLPGRNECLETQYSLIEKGGKEKE